MSSLPHCVCRFDPETCAETECDAKLPRGGNLRPSADYQDGFNTANERADERIRDLEVQLAEAISRAVLRVRLDPEDLASVIEWQPIETAPKDGSDILALARAEAFVGFWREKDRAWFVNDYHDQHQWQGYAPTHWMPLPEPPSVLPLAEGGEG